jgi:hypothetical protein
VTATAVPGDTATEPDAGRAAARLGRLRTGVRGIGRSGTATERLERLLLIAGGILLPLGVAFIILGWYRAAHTPWLFEQIPYSLSGGVLGGAMVIVGGFLYFGYWLTRLVGESRRQTQLLAEALDRLERAADRSPNGAAASAPAGTLVATQTGTMVHRTDCPVVKGRDNLRRVRADAKGFEACTICNPLTPS